MTTPYRSAFREALHEMEMALKAKDGLERRLSELKDALPALAQLAGPTRQEHKLMEELVAAAENGAMNLTRAVRLELAMAAAPLTTVQIRDLLLQRKFSFSSYSNPMAAIHSALNRMASAGQVLVDDQGRRTRYLTPKKWVRSAVVPANQSRTPKAK